MFRSPDQALLHNYPLAFDDSLFTPPGPDIHVLKPHPFGPLQQLPAHNQEYKDG